MADSIITVENVSKKYLIGHQAERYTALRDVVTNSAKGVFRKTKAVLTGSFNDAGNTIEEFWALKDVSFEIKAGDRLGIIGRNGAGKSTLLKVLSRITEPTHGRITIKGRVASLLEVGTGFHPELSGRENVYLNGAILGMSRQEIKKKFDEIVAFAEVERFLDTPVKRYSSGMYVRLAFAVAAHLEPEILIVDEVLAVGDAQFQKKCLGKMEDVSRNEGRTVLFVSHNMGVIAQLCQKAICMQHGTVINLGNTRDVIDSYLIGTKSDNNAYIFDTETNKSGIFCTFFQTLNKNGVPTENFQFDESIVIYVKLKINEYDSIAKVSITLQNSNGDYLSTLVEDLADLILEQASNELSFKIQLPPNVIAPNSYSFRIAVFTTTGTVYDLQEMISPIRIHDSGSKLSLFEGINYGNFFLDYTLTS